MSNVLFTFGTLQLLTMTKLFTTIIVITIITFFSFMTLAYFFLKKIDK